MERASDGAKMTKMAWRVGCFTDWTLSRLLPRDDRGIVGEVAPEELSLCPALHSRTQGGDRSLAFWSEHDAVPVGLEPLADEERPQIVERVRVHVRHVPRARIGEVRGVGCLHHEGAAGGEELHQPSQ